MNDTGHAVLNGHDSKHAGPEVTVTKNGTDAPAGSGTKIAVVNATKGGQTLPTSRLLSYCHGVDEDCPPDYRAMWAFLDDTYSTRSSKDMEWIYVSETKERLSYAEIYEKAQLYAKGMIALGLKKGDTMFLSGITGSDYFTLCFAGFSIGVICAASFVYDPQQEIAKQYLLKMEVNLLVLGHDRDLQNTILAMFDEDDISSISVPSLKHVLIEKDGGTVPKFVKPLTYLLVLAESVDDVSLSQRKHTINPHDPAFAAMSTGSTGAPKVIILPQVAFVQASYMAHWIFEDPEKANYASVHTSQDDLMSLYAAIATLRKGSKLTILPHTMYNVEHLEEILRLTETERLTSIFMPPYFWKILEGSLHLLKKYDVSSLNGGITGGQVVTTELRQKLLPYFPNLLLLYGMSECISVAVGRVADTLEERCTYTGKVWCNTECLIVDEVGSIVPIGSEGELWIRGPGMFLYYKNEPERTMAAKRIQDNWFPTGDAAIMTEDGHLTVLGRTADAMRLKVLGDVVYPGPIEDFLLKKNPGMFDCCVVGHHTDLIGDEIVYCIVPKKDQEMTVKSVADWALENMETTLYLPVRVFFFESLPRIGVRQKTSRREISSQIAAMVAEDANAGWTGLYDDL